MTVFRLNNASEVVGGRATWTFWKCPLAQCLYWRVDGALSASVPFCIFRTHILSCNSASSRASVWIWRNSPPGCRSRGTWCNMADEDFVVVLSFSCVAYTWAASSNITQWILSTVVALPVILYDICCFSTSVLCTLQRSCCTLCILIFVIHRNKNNR